MDAQAQDTGQWRCHVKKDLRSHLFSEAFINVDVAAPYSLSVAVPTNVKFHQENDFVPSAASNNTAEEEIGGEKLNSFHDTQQHASCSASSLDRHGGGIEPKLTWFVNGIQLKNMSSEMVEKLVSYLVNI